MSLALSSIARDDLYDVEAKIGVLLSSASGPKWPPRARRYETGVYADEVLQHYFPPSMAVIANIAAG